MRLKSKSLALTEDSSSSSPLVLMAQTGTNRRPSSPQLKSRRPCFNFAKGSCRFGTECRFAHDPNAKIGDVTSSKSSGRNNNDDLLVKLLERLGLNDTKHATIDSKTSSKIATVAHSNSLPVAYGPKLPMATLDYMTRRVLLRCDSTGDLYPVTSPSIVSQVSLVSQHTWHQRLGHPGSEVLRRLIFNNFIFRNKEKPPTLFHACQLGEMCVIQVVISRQYAINSRTHE
nr:ribonuclease H-like domain-containing protein [Tanacetum cinerariifolium]